MMLPGPLRTLLSRLADPLLRRRREDRLDDEVRAHLDLLTDDYLARGLTPEDARAAARRAFGGVDQIKEAYRDRRGLPFLDALAQDLRFSARLLRRDRAFAATAVFVLGTGVGVNNMMFTILNAHTLRGLPIADADRIVYISTFDDRIPERGVSYPEFLGLAGQPHGLAALAAFTSAPVAVAGDARAADRFDATFVTANAFELLGIRPVRGRGFLPEEDRPGAPRVVMLGAGAWQSRYGGEAGIVGRAVIVNGAAATVVGVVPDRSGFPTTAQVWLPLSQAPGLSAQRHDVRTLRLLGRLRDGVSIDSARAEVQAVVDRLAREHPDTSRNLRARLVPINERYFGRLTDPAWLAFITAGFLVVMISSANVANLMLGRSIARAREFAIRTSLGASRRRLVRQLLIEGVTLAALGGVAGFGLSVASVRLFRSAIPGDALPYWLDYSVDARVLAALVLVSLATVLVFALLPALHASKADINRVLKDGGRGGGRGAPRWTTVFLAAEFALAVVLLAQVVTSFRVSRPPLATDGALRTRDVVTAALTLPAGSYATPDQRNHVYRRLRERVRAIAGVSSVSIASVLPVMGGEQMLVAIAGRPRDDERAAPTLRTVLIAPEYFRTLGISMIRGRDFRAQDGTPGNAHAIVNERFVSRFVADADPIGQRIEVGPGQGAASTVFTIVGIAPDIRQRPVPDAEPVVYLPCEGAPPSTIALLVRSGLEPASLVPLVRNEVLAVDAQVPVYRFKTMENVVRDADWNGRVSHMLILAITFVAVALSTVGLYAVTAHGVRQRSQEIGVRVALGARPSHVVWMVSRRALLQLAAGFFAGILFTIVWDWMFASGRPGVRAADPQLLAAIAATLALAALIACAVPARRATRLDPVAAIRGD